MSWSKEKRDKFIFLKKEGKTAKEIAVLFNRSPTVIQNIARRLCLKFKKPKTGGRDVGLKRKKTSIKRRPKIWNENEDLYLLKNYSKYTCNQMADFLERNNFNKNSI